MVGKGTSFQGKLVLIVEDEPAILEIMERVLAKCGAEVLVAGDALTALKIIHQRRNIDLLIADGVLPGSLSGGELISRFNESSEGRRSILISGYPLSRIRGVEEEDIPFLQKPFNLKDLIESVALVFR